MKRQGANDFSLSEIQEAETWVWFRDRFLDLEDFVKANAGGSDVLELIERLKEDNDQWKSENAEMLGRLSPPVGDAQPN